MDGLMKDTLPEGTSSLTSARPGDRIGLAPLEPILMSAPVQRVVVFEDRAQVTRQGVVSLPAGSHRLRVEEVTPLAGERSLQVKAVAGALEIGDSRVLRALVLREPVGRLGELEAESRRLAERQLELQHQLSRLQHRVDLQGRWLTDIRGRWGAASARGVDPAPFAERARAVMVDREAAALERVTLNRSIEEVKRQKAEIDGRIAVAQQPTGVYTARLEARVEVQAPGTFEIEWSYIVPCALWRPEHQARLHGTGEQGRLSFETRGVVWQSTGEAWDDVELACSTARPGRAAAAPLLYEELLHTRRKSDQERREVVAELRDEEIQTTGLGGAQVASSMPGVDDGGEALTWSIPGRTSVPSNGRPVRVPLSRWEAISAISRVAMPERLSQVLLRGEQINPGPRPILAGPVILHQGSGYVGRTSIGFVAANERFALSFGSLDSVRVNRERRVKQEETRLTGYQTRTVTVSLALSNLSDQPIRIDITERIPVSELEEVRVTMTDQSPARPDGEGHVSWTEILAPRGHQTRELVYRVEAPARVDLPIY